MHNIQHSLIWHICTFVALNFILLDRFAVSYLSIYDRPLSTIVTESKSMVFTTKPATTKYKWISGNRNNSYNHHG